MKWLRGATAMVLSGFNEPPSRAYEAPTRWLRLRTFALEGLTEFFGTALIDLSLMWALVFYELGKLGSV